MHPALNYLSVLSWTTILATEETTTKFMQEVGLLPSKDSPCPPCPNCGAQTKVVQTTNRKFSFRYICSERVRKKCNGTVSPVKNTIMEQTRLPFRDVMFILFAFVKEWKVSEIYDNLVNWRGFREDSTVSWHSVIDYYGCFREVTEIMASHHSKQLGGPNKTITLHDTFFMKRKYIRGRRTASMAQTVLGIFCKEDHEGLLFLVDGKKKDLWPLIKEHIHPDTTIICTDGGRKSSTRSVEKMILKNMAMKYYRRTRLDPIGKRNHGAQVWQFIQDVIEVYPGCLKPGLDLYQIDKVISKNVGIEEATEIERSIDFDVTEFLELDMWEEEGDEDWEFTSGPVKKKKC